MPRLPGNWRYVIKRSGSPYGITIPPALAVQIGLRPGMIVKIVLDDQRLIIERVGLEELRREGVEYENGN